MTGRLCYTPDGVWQIIALIGVAAAFHKLLRILVPAIVMRLCYLDGRVVILKSCLFVCIAAA